MSILNVNQIQPVGSGQTVTISAANITASSSAITASSITATSGTLSGISSVSTTNLTVNGNAIASTGPLSNRNIIINGAMTVAQRGTQATGVTDTNFRTVDRFKEEINSLGTWTIDQATDAPDDFTFSFKATCTTANASPTANAYSYLGYKVEAQDLQKLNYGSSAARAMILSFWVKSNKTGNSTVTVLQRDNSIKLLSPQYSISSANTWEYKTISIPGDTAGVINNDNGSGLELEFYFNAGSTYTSGSHQTTWSTYNASNRCPSNLGVGGATSDYFAITGVQLEVGTVATPFEHRSYGDELARCQRYYHRVTSNNDHTIGVGYNQNTSATRHMIFFPVTMRVQPSALEQSGTAADYSIYHGTSLTVCTSVPIFTNCTTHCAEVQAAASGSLTAGQGSLLSMESTGYLGWSAEL